MSSKGVVAIYIKDTFEAFEREDLKSNDEEFEAVWIEIRKKKSKNIIIGCTDRHYHNAVEYVNKTKFNKENKEVHICRDFHFDLLKYETVNHCKEFYNTMASNGHLPHITIPTRITDSSMTIIENISTNTK